MTPQSRKLGLPLMNVIKLKGVPILKQLHLEERLLRTSPHNYCIINDGTNTPNIVMGISGKPAELLEINSVLREKIPVIRRFTGGGTVIVDSGTIFVTFICNKDDVPAVQPYPRPIMSWSSSLYKKVFQGVGDFILRENESRCDFDSYLAIKLLIVHFPDDVDYAFGSRKFGGNAQTITKNRWIHHTSFLWDYESSNMAYLKLPKRAPEYRLSRSHSDFICCMKDYMPRMEFITRTVDAVESEFTVRFIELEAVESRPDARFKHYSKILTEQELEEAVSK